MLQALTLLTMALQLLIAANNPHVPDSIKQQAVSVANFAIQVANTALKESSVVSVAATVPAPISSPEPSPQYQPIALGVIPEPTPLPPPTPSSPQFVSGPTVKTESCPDHSCVLVTEITLTADKGISCGNEYRTSCIYSERIDKVLYCHGIERDRFNPNPYLFKPYTTYTCGLAVDDRHGKRLPEFQFTTGE